MVDDGPGLHGERWSERREDHGGRSGVALSHDRPSFQWMDGVGASRWSLRCQPVKSASSAAHVDVRAETRGGGGGGLLGVGEPDVDPAAVEALGDGKEPAAVGVVEHLAPDPRQYGVDGGVEGALLGFGDPNPGRGRPDRPPQFRPEVVR